jgi:hypothetical protein
MPPAKPRSIVWLLAGVLCMIVGMVALGEAFSAALLLFGLGLVLLAVYASPLLPQVMFTRWDLSDVLALIRLLWRMFSAVMDGIAHLSDVLAGRTPAAPPPRAAERRVAERRVPPPGIQPLPPRQPPPPPEETAPADAQTRLPDGRRAYAHAINAARAAGLDLRAQALPVDLGFMAFSGGERTLYRSIPPADDAEFLQPFIVLQLATRASGRLRFEIIDPDGQRLFVHEDQHALKPGANLISPAARLRILPSHHLAGRWELRISADGVPLATHAFIWRESRATLLRRTLREDGELHQEARQRLLDESRVQRLTLDDLLAEDSAADEAPVEERVSRRS